MPPTEPRPEPPVPEGELDIVLALSGLRAADAEDALRTLAAHLLDEGSVAEGFPAALLERERSYPTGLPTPLPTAIPHVDPEYVHRPGLAIATLAEPVGFGEMGGGTDEDGQVRRLPVRLIAMPLLTDARAHLRALQHLMAVLRDEAQVTRLLDAADDTDLAGRASHLLAGEEDA